MKPPPPSNDLIERRSEGYQVIRQASSGEKRAGITRIQKAELVYLKALAYEDLSKPAEARGLYRYLSIHFGETRFGMMARNKVN